MTKLNMALMDLFRKYGLEMDGDFLREGVPIIVQMLIELEAGKRFSAKPHKIAQDRTKMLNWRRPGRLYFHQDEREIMVG